MDITETEIIMGKPKKIFANIEGININIRNNTKLIQIKAKEDMMTAEGRATRGRVEHKRL